MFQIITEMYHHFEIISKHVREYMRFNTARTQITVRRKPPSGIEPDPVSYFLASVNELIEYALENVEDGGHGSCYYTKQGKSKRQGRRF
jgi:hypothetical protein